MIEPKLLSDRLHLLQRREKCRNRTGSFCFVFEVCGENQGDGTSRQYWDESKLLETSEHKEVDNDGGRVPLCHRDKSSVRTGSPPNPNSGCPEIQPNTTNSGGPNNQYAKV